MTRDHIYKLVYWIIASFLIAFLLLNSLPGFWNTWLVALLFLVAVLIVKYGIEKVRSLGNVKRYLRYFLLAIVSLYWVYLSISLAYWYILELNSSSLEQIIINPVFIWIVIGFFVGVEYLLFRKKEKPDLENVTIYSNRKKTILVVENIAYIESRGYFTIAVLFDGSEYKNQVNISSWDNKLTNFIRVHRSFLVNPTNSVFQGDEIIINSEWKIPVSRGYKQKVLKVFSKL
ncbi:MAG: LytTR family transcriptional regulator [Flavobacteriaceae bacterium]|nr:LytTR family transcriptional regulator [Bacteroidia bacterium]NNL16101.1 LytTR family transcriptional regulator [Flavobacteriaceae bacterium]